MERSSKTERRISVICACLADREYANGGVEPSSGGPIPTSRSVLPDQAQRPARRSIPAPSLTGFFFSLRDPWGKFGACNLGWALGLGGQSWEASVAGHKAGRMRNGTVVEDGKANLRYLRLSGRQGIRKWRSRAFQWRSDSYEPERLARPSPTTSPKEHPRTEFNPLTFG